MRGTGSGPLVTWEQRLVGVLPLRRELSALLLAAGLFASYAGLAALLGYPLSGQEPGEALAVPGGGGAALVLALLIAYCILVVESGIRSNGDDIAALARVVPGKTAEELREVWAASLRDARPYVRLAGALGLAVGLAFWGLTAVVLARRTPLAEVLVAGLWFLFAVPLLFHQLLRAALFTALGLRVLSQQADRGLSLDLLDTSGLAPFARMGLRNAVLWILGSTLASVMFLIVPMWELVTLPPVIAVLVGLAIAALIYPVQRARRELRRAKRRELLRLGAEIRRDRAALSGAGEEAAAAAARLPGLIAYRGLIESVHEWPLDAPTLMRFALYLLIPLGGWLGGAFVERLIDAWLG